MAAAVVMVATAMVATARAARLATAVSCIKCTRIGGRAGIPDWDTVQKYLKTGEIDYTEIDERVAFYGRKLQL